MGQHSDKARETLLDAAEELFATEGVDAVSNRRITEHAGTANHSAIKYHFDGREGLIKALLARGQEDMRSRRRDLLDSVAGSTQLSDALAPRILPWVEHLAALPTPSWRARCLEQLGSIPSVRPLIAATVAEDSDFRGLLGENIPELAHVPEEVLRARAGILGHLVVGLCAEHEGQLESGTARGSWHSVGYFLIDAATGLLSAPVTHREDFIPPPASMSDGPTPSAGSSPSPSALPRRSDRGA